MAIHMETETLDVYADTLKMAADTVGGPRDLARFLGVTPEELVGWMHGREPAPLEHFLAALDILGERPYLKRAGTAAQPAS